MQTTVSFEMRYTPPEWEKRDPEREEGPPLEELASRRKTSARRKKEEEERGRKMLSDEEGSTLKTGFDRQTDRSSGK